MASKKKRHYLTSVDEVMALREAGAHILWRTAADDKVEPWHFSLHGLKGTESSECAAESAKFWLDRSVQRLFVEIAE